MKTQVDNTSACRQFDQRGDARSDTWKRLNLGEKWKKDIRSHYSLTRRGYFQALDPPFSTTKII